MLRRAAMESDLPTIAAATHSTDSHEGRGPHKENWCKDMAMTKSFDLGREVRILLLVLVSMLFSANAYAENTYLDKLRLALAEGVGPVQVSTTEAGGLTGDFPGRTWFEKLKWYFQYCENGRNGEPFGRSELSDLERSVFCSEKRVALNIYLDHPELGGLFQRDANDAPLTNIYGWRPGYYPIPLMPTEEWLRGEIAREVAELQEEAAEDLHYSETFATYCNKTNFGLSLSFLDVDNSGAVISRGWYNIEPGQCKEWSTWGDEASFVHAKIYGRPDLTFGAITRGCIISGKAFELTYEASQSYCPAGAEFVSFDSVPKESTPTTIDLEFASSTLPPLPRRGMTDQEKSDTFVTILGAIVAAGAIGAGMEAHEESEQKACMQTCKETRARCVTLCTQ